MKISLLVITNSRNNSVIFFYKFQLRTMPAQVYFAAIIKIGNYFDWKLKKLIRVRCIPR